MDFLHAKEEDALFNTRLHEINKEMQNILEKTNSQRDSLYTRYANLYPSSAGITFPGDSYQTPHVVSLSGATTATTSTTRAAAADAVSPAAAATPSPRATLAAANLAASLVGSAEVQREVARWMEANFATTIAAVVEEQVKTQLRGLLSEVASLRERQEAAQEDRTALRNEWAEEKRAARRMAAEGLQAAQLAAQSHRASVDSGMARWAGDLAVLRDSVQGLEAAVRAGEQRSERRLTELARSNTDAVQSSLADLEALASRHREELMLLLREKVRTFGEQSDALEAHVSRLQGLVSSIAEAVNRCTGDVRVLMDDSVTRGSEMRACRRDVNRLELLVQCVGMGADGKIRGGTSSSSSPPPPPVILAQELATAKERIQTLALRLEGTERHVQQLETALTHVLLVASGGGNDSPASIASTRRPSNALLYQMLPQQQQHASATTTTTSMYNSSGASGGTRGGDAVGQLYSADSVHPHMMRQQQQQQPHLGNHTNHNGAGAVIMAQQGSSYGLDPHQRHQQQLQQYQLQQQRFQQLQQQQGRPTSMNGIEIDVPRSATIASGVGGSSQRWGSPTNSASANISATGASVSGDGRLPHMLELDQPQRDGAADATTHQVTPVIGARWDTSSHHTTIPHEAPPVTSEADDKPKRSVSNGGSDEGTVDSYVSERVTSQLAPVPRPSSLSARASDQYIPAPTSDTESERDNLQLSRLALD